MLSSGDALQVVDVVIGVIVVLVVNLVARRDRPNSLLPHVDVQIAEAASNMCDASPIVRAIRPPLRVRVAIVFDAVEDNAF